MNLRQMLETRISEALADAGAEDFPAMVSPSARPEFGDYQANGCMAAAKQLKTNPRKLAEQVAAAVAKKLAGVAETVEAAGPGFINVKLSNAWLGGELFERSGDGHLGAVKPEIPKTVVIDYSSPNIAKEMHVGHLRSTIIGDSLSRILDFLGHRVIRQNHIGDWGTQFGMVILAMWHIAMAEHRGEHDYISGSLKRLSGISPSAPVGDRREALQPIRDLHEKELSADWHGENVFYNYLKEVEKNRSLALDDLLPAYQFVNLVETLADGTGLTVESPPEHKPVPLQSVSRHITTMLQNRVDPRNEQ